MARRENRAPRRPAETAERKGKGGGMLSGLIVGLVLGLVMAAGLAWYFNRSSENIRPVGVAAGEDPAPRDKTPDAPLPPPPPAAPESKPETDPARDQAAAEPPAKPVTPAAAEPTQSGKSRVPLTFYGILPGDKPAKPLDPPKSNEIWWLQIAALKNPGDADKLRARLLLLNLHATTQKIESGGQTLYRVRVGPYKREDDALGDLDVLAQNNFEPRLLKEPVKP